MRVELEHETTGTVAVPVEVRVLVTRIVYDSLQEVKVRVLSNEGGASEGSDKFFVAGPMSTQVVMPLVAARGDDADGIKGVSKLQGQQVCVSILALVPLRPGWLSMPRVQVLAGGVEATSVPTSVFIFPSTQPVVWRSSG